MVSGVSLAFNPSTLISIVGGDGGGVSGLKNCLLEEEDEEGKGHRIASTEEEEEDSERKRKKKKKGEESSTSAAAEAAPGANGLKGKLVCACVNRKTYSTLHMQEMTIDF